MKIGEDVLTMCRLVAFADNVKRETVAENLDVEGYARDVWKRFKKLYPDAEMLFGNERGLSISHVRFHLEGRWEFVAGSMSVTVWTDGSIHMDEGMAEVIFNHDTRRRSTSIAGRRRSRP